MSIRKLILGVPLALAVFSAHAAPPAPTPTPQKQAADLSAKAAAAKQAEDLKRALESCGQPAPDV